MNRTIENFNLRQALLLRKDGRLAESQTALEAACQEGDGKALYLKGRALFTGGWLYERSYRLSEECRHACLLADCIWLGQVEDDTDDAFTRFLSGHAGESYPQGIAEGHFLIYAYPDVRGVDTFPHVLVAANFGDERCQYRVGRHFRETNPELSFQYFLKGAMQKHRDCMYKVARYYEKGKGCKKDLFKAAEWFIAGDFKVSIPDRLYFAYTNHIWELVYIYARACRTNIQLQYMTEGSRECKDAIFLCDAVVYKVKQAVLWFNLVFKRCGFLTKDTRRVVGEMIWNSRYQMDEWIKMQSAATKKIKTK